MPWSSIGGGYDDVQDTAPSSPSIGDTWFDTSTDNGTGKIYADLGGGAQWHVLPVQDELQSGRTRELLLLLQDRPIPEVQDPMNLQSGLSAEVIQSGGDYVLDDPAEESTSWDPDQNYDSQDRDGYGMSFNPDYRLEKIEFTVYSQQSDPVTDVKLLDGNNNVLETFDNKTGGETTTVTQTFNKGEWYKIEGSVTDGNINERADKTGISNSYAEINGWDAPNDTDFDIVFFGGLTTYPVVTEGYATDYFSAPTTEPTDFKQWNAIRAEDVTTGGSTSANPVEFEILDSTDAVLNSSHIPKSQIADTAFKLRDRESTTTASAGQTQFTIPETGAGGHYGIPILSVVTVEQNGSVLNGAWEFDGTDTVTLDSGASDGDTITISYDLDVFDSTLQPRAYLSREDSSEDSPSISHFRYEYVI